MNPAERAEDDRKFAGRSPGAPEPFFTEVADLLPGGLALDVAAGLGRHSLALARRGMRVVAVDHSAVAVAELARLARDERLDVWPAVTEIETFLIEEQRYNVVLNVNFLDRGLVPNLKRALVPGGTILFDTFLVDQAALGHPLNPAHLLGHYELRELLTGLELLRYREGIMVYPDGRRAWRASALASRM